MREESLKNIINNIGKNNCIVISSSLGNTKEQMQILEDLKIDDYNLINFKDIVHSDCYTPFYFLNTDERIFNFCDYLEEELRANKVEKILLEAIIFFLCKYRPMEEQNFISVIKLLRATNFNEGYDNSPLDRIFREVKKRDPNGVAAQDYTCYKMAETSERRNAIIELLVGISQFASKRTGNFLGYNTINFDEFINGQKILLLCMPNKSDRLYIYAKFFMCQLIDFINTNGNDIYVNKANRKTFVFFDKTVSKELKEYIMNSDTEYNSKFEFFNLQNEKSRSNVISCRYAEFSNENVNSNEIKIKERYEKWRMQQDMFDDARIKKSIRTAAFKKLNAVSEEKINIEENEEELCESDLAMRYSEVAEQIEEKEKAENPPDSETVLSEINTKNKIE